MLVAVGVFALSATVSALLALTLPLLLGAVGLAIIVGARSPVAGLRVMALGGRGLFAAFGLLGDFFSCLWLPFAAERALADAPFPPLVVPVPPAAFIELHRLQQEVATALGVEPVDELWLSPDAALGICEADREDRRVRVLVVGLELVRALSPLQLRAALAHEFGHLRGGDLWLGRWNLRFIRVLAAAHHRFSPVNPAWWGSGLSLWVMLGAYLPWSRAKEYAADRLSAQVVGSAPAVEALRRAREVMPLIEVSLSVVLRRILDQRIAPVSLGHAVRAVMAGFSPAQRHSLKLRGEGDPLDTGGRTHPPTAARIAALTALRFPTPQLPPVPPWSVQRLDQLEERLTRQWLKEAPVRQWVTAQQFLSAGSQPPAPRAAPEPAPVPSDGSGGEDVSPYTGLGSEVSADPGAHEGDAGGSLELDLDRDWVKRRGPR